MIHPSSMEMDWVRGHTVGRGRFGTVTLAIPTNSFSKYPPLMAVKSCHASNMESLRTEKEVLSCMGDCPEIVKLLGDEFSSEKGVQFYNLFMEYAHNGSLYDHVKSSSGKLEVSDVRRFTRSILRGLSHIHDKGFAHCDIKLQNILVFGDGAVKIADFGLAKRITDEEEKKKKNELRGTPLYLSPELAAGERGGTPADVWALGCAVVEMVSGKPAWDCSPGSDVSALIYRIGTGQESPEIPPEMCSEGRDFLGRCFERDPNERWTARMLLNHPFVSGSDDDELSPRCPFDLSDWDVIEPSTPDPVLCPTRPISSLLFGIEMEDVDRDGDSGCWGLDSGRIDELIGDGGWPDWCDSDGWVTVR